MGQKSLRTTDLEHCRLPCLVHWSFFFPIRPQFQRARQRIKLIITNRVKLNNFFFIFLTEEDAP